MAEDKREKIIKVRVSAEELETLKHLQTKAQLAVWMRETCLNYGQGDLVSQAKGPEPVDPVLLRELAGIGNNLNQIARKVNGKEWGPANTFTIVGALKSIESEIAQLREQFR